MLAMARSHNAADEGDTIPEVCFTKVLGFSSYGVDAGEVYDSMEHSEIQQWLIGHRTMPD
jgi:hypothetical protein